MTMFDSPRLPTGAMPLRFCLIVIFSLMLFPNCSTILKPPIQKPLSHHETVTILTMIREQEKKVFSFYAYGRVLFKKWSWESESNILTVGTRDPFKIKIEITHPWGQPILHILIDQSRLEVLSFSDNKLFLGPFTPESLSRFFPGHFDSDLIWAALRGYPNLLRHNRIASLKANQISLFNNREKEVEIIDFYPDELLPRRVSFPEQHIGLTFSNFQENNGIYYAREVKVGHIRGKKNLTLKNRKMVFNKTIPKQIFVLEKPPAFETVYLDENLNGSF